MSSRHSAQTTVAIVLVGLLLASCGAPFPIDGELDCETEFPWTESGSVPEGTPGFGDPALAIEEYLSPFLDNHGGELVMIDGHTGSLVLDNREVVVGVATEAPAGGWLVLVGKGCEDFDRK
jgi:hypothetical protein